MAAAVPSPTCTGDVLPIQTKPKAALPAALGGLKTTTGKIGQGTFPVLNGDKRKKKKKLVFSREIKLNQEKTACFGRQIKLLIIRNFFDLMIDFFLNMFFRWKKSAYSAVTKPVENGIF